jgi:hypothetical protein
LYDVGWARAIVSDTTVALLYAQRQQVGGDRQRVLLDLFDTADGTRLGRRFVQDGYIDLQRIEPLAVGHTVWIGGEGSRGEPDRIDIWSDR